MGWTKKQGEIIKNVLSRLHGGRARYIYTGLVDRDDIIILGSHAESDFKYGDPTQIVAMVVLKTPEIKTLIHEFLSYFKINLLPETPMIYDLKTIIALANNTKWTLQDVYVYSNANGVTIEAGGKKEIIGKFMISFYNFTQLEKMTNEVYRVLLTDMYPHHEILSEYSKTTPRVYKVKILGDLLKGTSLESFSDKNYQFLAMHGIETLQASQHVKFSEKEIYDYKYGIKLWSTDEGSLRFGGYYSDPYMDYLGSRVYTYVVKHLKEP